jgi:hypothetical protein
MTSVEVFPEYEYPVTNSKVAYPSTQDDRDAATKDSKVFGHSFHFNAELLSPPQGFLMQLLARFQR